jgi:hypothetical protein
MILPIGCAIWEKSSRPIPMKVLEKTRENNHLAVGRTSCRLLGSFSKIGHKSPFVSFNSHSNIFLMGNRGIVSDFGSNEMNSFLPNSGRLVI